MSYAEVDICNMALARIGITTTIATLNESTKEARMCKRFYAFARDLVLEKAPWPFAVKTEAPALLVDADKLPGWSYQYATPTDCLKVLAVVPEGEVTETAGYYTNCADDAPWMPVRESRHAFRRALSVDDEPMILANIEDVYLVYVARVTNTAAFSTMMISLIADRLAMELSVPLTVDPRYFQLCQNRFEGAFVDTVSREVEQETHSPNPDPPSIRARA